MDTSTQADSAGAADTSLTGFYAGMSMPERRTFWACAAGWALDGMDFMIYPLIIGTIMQQWSVLPGQAGLAATATLLTSAAGGWAAGFLADRIGRVRTMQITILWFGFGGEWAAGAVLLGETIRPEFRGRAVGCVQSAWAVGWAAAVLVQIAIFSVLPPETAWRAMLAAGCLPALLVVYLRRSVKEPEVAAAARSALARSGDQPGLARIFAPALLRTTVLASLLCMGAQGGYYAISTWLPQFLRTTRGLTILNSTPYLAVLIAGSFVGYLVGAWLVDRIGRRPTFMIFSVGAVTLVLAYTQLQIGNGAMLVLGFPLGFFASGYFSGIGPLLTELYPTAVRGSGQGFCYSFGRGIGALFPALVGYLSQTMSLANAMGLFAVMAYGLLFLAALLLPETRGRALVADA
jgi:MFS family permease